MGAPSRVWVAWVGMVIKLQNSAGSVDGMFFYICSHSLRAHLSSVLSSYNEPLSFASVLSLSFFQHIDHEVITYKFHLSSPP